MTKKHSPKNRSRHSRTNGRPPENALKGPTVWDGSSFMANIPLALRGVDSVEIWERTEDEWTHIAATVSAALALSSLPSPLDLLCTIPNLENMDREPQDGIEQHIYAMPTGIALTLFLPEAQHLILVIGAASVGHAQRVARNALLQGAWNDERVHPLYFHDFVAADTKTETILSVALSHLEIGDLGLPRAKELLPFVLREQRVDPEASLAQLLKRSIAVHRKLYRRGPRVELMKLADVMCGTAEGFIGGGSQ